jgi:hypothetical protein
MQWAHKQKVEQELLHQGQKWVTLVNPHLPSAGSTHIGFFFSHSTLNACFVLGVPGTEHVQANPKHWKFANIWTLTRFNHKEVWSARQGYLWPWLSLSHSFSQSPLLVIFIPVLSLFLDPEGRRRWNTSIHIAACTILSQSSPVLCSYKKESMKQSYRHSSCFLGVVWCGVMCVCNFNSPEV